MCWFLEATDILRSCVRIPISDQLVSMKYTYVVEERSVGNPTVASRDLNLEMSTIDSVLTGKNCFNDTIIVCGIKLCGFASSGSKDSLQKMRPPISYSQK